MNETNEKIKSGYISSINGSLIEIKGLENYVRLNDLIKESKHKILGEVIQIYSDHVTVQCFENTSNLKLNEEVISLQEPLSMELGPGLLGNIFDGIQRPLEATFLSSEGGGFLKRGVDLPALSRTKDWHFKPVKKINDYVSTGYVVGTVQETEFIEHKIMIPLGISGKITYIAKEGEYTVSDEIYRLKNGSKEKSFNMIQKWPITKNRPYKERGFPNEPLITGMRVIDLLFPIVKGGTVAVPGGFGTGKTVIQQSLAKWCNADIIIFVGCGERGNEIADVLKQFSEITDPKSGRPLLERIVILANTSNMPVSAREASIFSGVTIGEYYRDMGYDVAVLADSTSRWAESLREISGLLEEMPAEEGYPAYLPSKISSFYERAGVVKILGEKDSGKEKFGSITIIGSVSPPSGDFSEPVTSTTKRFVQAFWALDASLAYSKHYPAINWLNSYSKYPEFISDWWFERDIYWPEIDIDWYECRKQINSLLSQENELKNVTQLVGEENLPENQQFILFISKLIRNGLLIQNAFDSIDCFTDVKKLIGLVKLILLLFKEGKQLLKQGFLIEDIKELDVVNDILRICRSVPNNNFDQIEKLRKKMLNEIESLKLTYGVFRKK
ncbi:MAG: V-type ATP synthase subunit A [Promethearchaeota archaeon Loki_b31]|nr:MAG: V-type ATP synthase subunit A [Candidatus Lokiarchaeota archaeon Loki_b31]